MLELRSMLMLSKMLLIIENNNRLRKLLLKLKALKLKI